jgi:hypothetical protein
MNHKSNPAHTLFLACFQNNGERRQHCHVRLSAWNSDYCVLGVHYEGPPRAVRAPVKNFSGPTARADRLNILTQILIVVFPCMLIITQLLFQQNALVY